MPDDALGIPWKEIFKKVDDAEEKIKNKASSYSVTFYNRLIHNLDSGLDEIYTEYEKRSRLEYGNMEGIVNAVAGGPNEGVVAPIYNAVGAVYPNLKSNQRKKALKGILDIMDGINYLNVQQAHTPYIREPLLLADIKLVYPFYWPGLEEYRDLIKRYRNFNDMSKEFISYNGMFRPEYVKSDFLFAYSLLRSDFSNFGEDFTKVANKMFLGRTMGAIVKMRFAYSENTIEESTSRLKELLPKSLHKLIEPLRESIDTSYVDSLRKV